MFITLGEEWQGLGPNSLQGKPPKWQTLTPGSPIALEGMPPTDGLLPGLVCLSLTLTGSLKGTVLAHVGNIEDEGLNL